MKLKSSEYLRLDARAVALAGLTEGRATRTPLRSSRFLRTEMPDGVRWWCGACTRWVGAAAPCAHLASEDAEGQRFQRSGGKMFKSGHRLLSDAAVRAIRAAPGQRGLLCDLAHEYGVSWHTVTKVRRGRAYRDVAP